MNRRILFIFAPVLLFTGITMSLCAQSNEVVDRLLGEDQATVADAGYLILSAAGIVPEDATPDLVIGTLTERKLLSGTRKADQPVTLGEVSYLIMETVGIHGGLFYSILPGPRYAARELASLKLIFGNTHPSRTISGQEVMRMLGAAMERKDGTP
jgi:hypothetical protein